MQKHVLTDEDGYPCPTSHSQWGVPECECRVCECDNRAYRKLCWSCNRKCGKVQKFLE